MKRTVLLPLVVVAILLAGIASFFTYRSATAMSAPDAQLRATARLLLPRLAHSRAGRGDQGLQQVLNSYAPLLYDRGQFAVVCWYSPRMHMLAPACVHASDDEGERLAVDVSQFDINAPSQPRSANVTFRGYSAPLIRSRSKQRADIYGVLDLYRVVR